MEEAGLQYKVSSSVAVRAGYNHAEVPIPAANTFFAVEVPAVFVNHYCVGLGIHATDSLTLDLAYYKVPNSTITGPIYGATGPIPGTSVTTRSGMKSFMHFSAPPPPCGGPAGRSNADPEIGAAPLVGNDEGGAPTVAPGAPPLTGGNGEALLGACPGSGAGNAPCAPAWPAWTDMMASANGTSKRRMIKVVSPARCNGRSPTSSPIEAQCSGGPFYDSCLCLTTRGIWQERGAAPHSG